MIRYVVVTFLYNLIEILRTFQQSRSLPKVSKMVLKLPMAIHNSPLSGYSSQTTLFQFFGLNWRASVIWDIWGALLPLCLTIVYVLSHNCEVQVKLLVPNEIFSSMQSNFPSLLWVTTICSLLNADISLRSTDSPFFSTDIAH